MAVSDPNKIRRIAGELLHEALGPKLPWYDSHWLERYNAAHAHLLANHPHRVDELEQLVDPLRTAREFETTTLRGFLDADELGELRAEIAEISARPVAVYEREMFGRDLTHDAPRFVELQTRLTDTVSELVGEPVEPGYNFLSLYGAEGICAPHMDSPDAKWTLDICVEQSQEWPIYLSPVVDWPTDWDPRNNNSWGDYIRSQNEFEPVVLQEGDAVLFAGSSQWHYRDPIPQPGETASDARAAFCHLLFLHYIPAGMRETMRPETWSDRLGLASLAPLCRHRDDQDYTLGMRG